MDACECQQLLEYVDRYGRMGRIHAKNVFESPRSVLSHVVARSMEGASALAHQCGTAVPTTSLREVNGFRPHCFTLLL